MISTDKAVNPTNVMGASKRICEMYIQSQSQLEGIIPSLSRLFWQCAGSNGSVCLFSKQLLPADLVTLTHRDITRYFMTIPKHVIGPWSRLYGERRWNICLRYGKPGEDLRPCCENDYACRTWTGSRYRDCETGLRPGGETFRRVAGHEREYTSTYHKKNNDWKETWVQSLYWFTTTFSLMNWLKSATDDQLVSAMKTKWFRNLFHKLNFWTSGSGIISRKGGRENYSNYFDLKNEPEYRWKGWWVKRWIKISCILLNFILSPFPHIQIVEFSNFLLLYYIVPS